jgi:hypothetical protein
MTDSQEHDQSILRAAFKIDWNVPDDAPTYYANNMLFQYGEHEGCLLFFEVVPPVIMGDPDEMKAQFEKIKAVTAKCKARIIIPKDMLQRFATVLQESAAKVSAFEQSDQNAANKLLSAGNSSLVQKTKG